jgi:cation transport ATPase
MEEIMPFDSGGQSRSTDDILLKAASVKQLSSHPAAQALSSASEGTREKTRQVAYSDKFS